MREEKEISNFLGICLNCIRDNPEKSLAIADEAHGISRSRFGLIGRVPHDKGIECKFCGNNCSIPEGGMGFCGLVRNNRGRIEREKDLLCSYYFDPLPTNCVASWFCAATGAGYPEFSFTKDTEYGYKNMAVFCVGCCFDCLFCQNWHFRSDITKDLRVGDDEFLNAIDAQVSCICFFGGDPSPQLDKIVRICKKAGEMREGILRFCLETNGNSNPVLLRKFAELGLESGGTIKFDLKFWNGSLNKALTGISNKRTLENFEMLAEFHNTRDKVPFLTASTLMIPGYIDEMEIENIARFIADIDKSIPYSLLAYYPHFEMNDLAFTRREDALRYKKIAENEGLENVRVGNIGILR